MCWREYGFLFSLLQELHTVETLLNLLHYIDFFTVLMTPMTTVAFVGTNTHRLKKSSLMCFFIDLNRHGSVVSWCTDSLSRTEQKLHIPTQLPQEPGDQFIPNSWSEPKKTAVVVTSQVTWSPYQNLTKNLGKIDGVNLTKKDEEKTVSTYGTAPQSWVNGSWAGENSRCESFH